MEHKSSQNYALILKRVSYWVAILAIIPILGTGAFFFKSHSHSQDDAQNPLTTSSSSDHIIKMVTALGRLEPEGEVINLSAPTSVQNARIHKLLVQEREQVRFGQVIAILDTRDRLQASLEKAQQEVKVAQARLAQVKAGAKKGEIIAQKATIARLEAQLSTETAAQKAMIARLQAELRNAQTEFQRYRQLHQEGAISRSNLDSKRLTMETLQEQVNEAKATLDRILKTGLEQINEAKATLNSIAEVRPTELQQTEAEVNSAQLAAKLAQAELDLAYVRSPINGQILKIHTWPGEAIGSEGIVDLGRTNQMYAVAEVYETDIGKVRVGQYASITSAAIAGELQGTVDQIGLQINKKDVLNTDPAADVDARVIEVKIRLRPEDSKAVAGFTRLQVQVAIAI